MLSHSGFWPCYYFSKDSPLLTVMTPVFLGFSYHLESFLFLHHGFPFTHYYFECLCFPECCLGSLHSSLLHIPGWVPPGCGFQSCSLSFPEFQAHQSSYLLDTSTLVPCHFNLNGHVYFFFVNYYAMNSIQKIPLVLKKNRIEPMWKYQKTLFAMKNHLEKLF